MAKPAAGVTRSSQVAALPDSSVLSTYGATMSTIAAVTATALCRTAAPMARASTATTANNAAVPTTSCSVASALTGSKKEPPVVS
jgi:hypothetical protein